MEQSINLDVTIDESLAEFVGDERKIKQILLNLLSTPSSSRRREDGSELTPSRSMARSRSQSMTPASESLRRIKQGSSRSFVRCEATMLTRRKGLDWG
jgi:nitrogen-specific signal transduction histidine kinase